MEFISSILPRIQFSVCFRPNWDDGGHSGDVERYNLGCFEYNHMSAEEITNNGLLLEYGRIISETYTNDTTLFGGDA